MKRLFLLLTVLATSMIMSAALVPQRIVVLGDDPTMVTDEQAGAVGYATLLQPLFDEAVTVVVKASAVQLPSDPALLLEPTEKGDIVLMCKQPVEEKDEELTMADIYLKQLEAIQQAARKKGVKIIWLTEVCPRYFTIEGKQVHRAGSFPEVVRRFCQRDLLPLIDLEALTFDWLTNEGQESSAKAYVPVKPEVPAGEAKAAREGNQLTQAGAEKVAALVGEALRADKKNILFKRLK